MDLGVLIFAQEAASEGGGFDIRKLWEEDILPSIVKYAPKIVAAIVIYIIGKWIAKIIRGVVRKAMKKANADPMLINFVASIAYTALVLFVVIAALGQLNVDTSSFAALIAAAGLAVGFALQGSLGNFAAGVMLIIFRPFKVGHFIEAAGVTGVVEEMQIFNTIMKTGDNKRVIVPNGKLTGDNITNYSANDTRRVDLVMGIGYDDDIKKAKTILEGILANHPKVLKDPAPAVALIELADSSVNFNVRPWCKTADYWAVYSEITETVKLEFDKAGISIPYPQQDVHMRQVA